MIDLSQFYSAGYFLIRGSHPGWEQLDRDLLPEKLISLSGHICPHLEVFWGWLPGNRDAALKFGIPEARLEEFLDWCREEYLSDMDMVSMFYSSEAARRFIQRFDLSTEDLHIIGVGIHHTLEEKNWREPGEDEVLGVEKRIEQHLPLEEGGQILGFEVVTYEYHDFACSWLCSYAHRDIYKHYGIRPNAYGIIDRFEDAMKVYEWIEDALEGRRGEPVPYDVALLVDYPLSSDS
jgi:hypothetical protein